MDIQIRKRQSKTGIRYQAVIEVWSDGKRTPITVGTYATEREAMREGDKALSKYETDIDKAAALRGKMTLREWAEEWLENRKGKIKESSRTEYSRKLRNYVLPFLGDIRLNELSPVHIRRWLDTLPIKKSLGSNSVDQSLGILQVCLSGAVKDGALRVNPAKGVTVERSRAVESELSTNGDIKAFTHDEAQLLLKMSEGHHHLDAFIVLGFLAGLRPGEIGGVKWEDIDFLNSTVTVRRANRKATSTKSGKVRVVPLPWEAVRRLEGLRSTPNLGESRKPNSGLSGPWVLPVHHNRAAEYLKPFCEALGVRYLPPHSLRHTYASLMLSGGVPVTTIAKRLGHSSPKVTLDVYSHAMPKDEDNATSLLERVLGVAPSPVPPGQGVSESLVPSTGTSDPVGSGPTG